MDRLGVGAIDPTGVDGQVRRAIVRIAGGVGAVTVAAVDLWTGEHLQAQPRRLVVMRPVVKRQQILGQVLDLDFAEQAALAVGRHLGDVVALGQARADAIHDGALDLRRLAGPIEPYPVGQVRRPIAPLQIGAMAGRAFLRHDRLGDPRGELHQFGLADHVARVGGHQRTRQLIVMDAPGRQRAAHGQHQHQHRGVHHQRPLLARLGLRHRGFEPEHHLVLTQPRRIALCQRLRRRRMQRSRA